MPKNNVSLSNSIWAYLPTPALFNVFKFLNVKELLNAGQVCVNWYNVSKDDFLWKDLLYENFKIDRSINIVAGKSWYEEFVRLCDRIPIVQTETLTDHMHQVLHVSFSHNGKYFATCSKDGFVLLWSSAYPAKVKYCRDMKSFSWKYTQYSQFNESDTSLLVSGVHFGTPHSTSGEIAVFNLQAGFELQCRIVNKPYDIFGTWYSDEHLLSGDLHWLAHLVSTSIVWINKASQETDSEHIPITHNMYRFYNRNASSIRAIMIADCLPNSENAGGEDDCEMQNVQKNQTDTCVEKGNPVSHRDIKATSNCNIQVSGEPSQQLRKMGGSFEYATPIRYNADYRRVESESHDPMLESDDSNLDDSDDDDDDDSNLNRNIRARSSEIDCDTSESSVEIDSDEEEEEEQESVVQNDKYLIFTTGFKTYTPHQIGFKRIKPVKFPKRLDPGPSLRERLVLHEQRKEKLRSTSPPLDPDWLDFDAVADKFDKIDHLIDLHGHIIGMGLSPDHRYLYVNSRPWPQGYTITNPLDPPPIAQEIDIHVIDLVTLKQVGTMLRSHKAYTPNNECFFIFLDVCEEYVASGAEDKHGYLWDRHYGICLAKFPHTDVVNSVAFNPKDPEMLVTTSDDQKIKVWRSRAKIKQLGLNRNDFQEGVELRIGRNKKTT